jgi:hypothetical protein
MKVNHLALVATLRTGAGAGLWASAFDIASVRRRAAYPAPNAKRITGPKVFAADMPTK